MEKPTIPKSKNKLIMLLQKAIQNLQWRNKNSDSTKISCIGQVKQRKKVAKDIHLLLHEEMCPALVSGNKGSLMKTPSNMRNNHFDNNGVSKHCALSEKAPCFDQTKRFPSCHGGQLTEFDWKIAQIETDDYIDEWKCNYSDFEELEQEEEEEEFSFSCPITGVSERDDFQKLKQRKEVNLWRRRKIDQLSALQLRPSSTSLRVHRSRGR